MSAVVSIYLWSMRARWRTWMFHALLGLMILIGFGMGAAIAYFGIREIEQFFIKKYITKEPVDPVDNFLDFAVMFYVVGIASLFGVGA